MHRISRRGWLTALVALAWLQGGAATAADKELLDILLSNGAINQAQYDELLEKEELTRDDVRKVIVTLDGKGFRVRSSDGAFSIRLGARLHADASGHTGSNASSEANNGTEVRRGRLNLTGTLWEDFLFQAEADFADNEVAVKDFLVGYTGFSWSNFLVGHQKQPFSLAVEMSSNDIPFVERGVDTDLVIPFIDRAIGFRFQSWGEQWFVAGGFYGDDANKHIGNEAWGSSLRGVWAPLRGEDRVLHLGVRGAFREPNNEEVRIRSETTHLSSLFTADTGDLVDVKRVFLVGPEAAFALGPIAVVGEYYHAFLDRRNGQRNLGFDGWHVEATWSMTGESRASSYRMAWGEFKGLRPSRNFSLRKGEWGALELATRYASIDLNDRDVSGGRQGVFTLGLNWYLNPSIRLLFNWSRIVDAKSLAFDADGLNTFQGRVDFHF